MSRHGLPHHPIICLFSNPVNIKTTSGVRTTPRWIRARTCCGDPLKSEMLGELKYSMLPVTGRCQQKRTGPAARPPGAPRRRRAVWGSVWVRGPARVSAGTARGYVSRQEAGGQRTGRLNTRFPRHAARPPQGLWGGDTAPPPRPVTCGLKSPGRVTHRRPQPGSSPWPGAGTRVRAWRGSQDRGRDPAAKTDITRGHGEQGCAFLYSSQ